ncbi:MAG: diguanylate cyclase [Desulfobacterales bacterium]|uniref:diguanylate cyclase n=1 Tax=Candidatus Desulfatibia vada TaxID=2841696 RepID=A0A8J6TLE8_9BACT|nr:diguanylate cyclase [Candidatus Desulfatibia vada]MBL6970531.1 diguanylate cyclase [Desulfobacterales bacterium]
MFRISTAARLSLGLVLLTTSILLTADMIGLIPSRTKAIISEREKLCESLAVYGSIAAQKNETKSILTAVKVLMKRNQDILSAALRKEDGTIMVETEDHGTQWQAAPPKGSIPTHVRVPVYKGENLWGNIEISFRPINRKGIAGIWTNTLVRLVGFVLLVGFIVYKLFLQKTLRHIDPSSVIPPRVKAALDTLTEGIILMDQNERIVLANAAFAEKIEQPASSLLGRKASKLKWTVPKSEEAVKDFPWLESLRREQEVTGVRMGLPTPSGRQLTFMVNGALILDHVGKCRGVLATFNDVTLVEEQNEQLQEMLEELEKSRDEVRRQNQELEVLATRDPLTDCLNRRAFFERFEIDLSAAKRYGHDLSCIMLDIDYFKSVNDTYGHNGGDRVLKGIAEVLQSLARESDFVCRYGGEEFCIVLTHTDIDGGVEAAERYRCGIESYDFEGISVTSSFGVSSIGLGAVESSEIIGEADKALYAAKEGGRNRVASWKQLKSSNGQTSLEAAAAASIVTTKEETSCTSPAGNVSLAALDDDPCARVQATSLESANSIKSDGGNAPLNQAITKAAVDADKLTYTAAANAGSDGDDALKFKTHDGPNAVPQPVP